jgi:hypothetical protein
LLCIYFVKRETANVKGMPNFENRFFGNRESVPAEPGAMVSEGSGLANVKRETANVKNTAVSHKL